MGRNAVAERWDGARKRRIRPISLRKREILHLVQLERHPLGAEPVHLPVVRPQVRGDCAAGPRPCPWVSCQYHLYLDVSRASGALTLNFPDLEPHEMEHSCALDLADEGGLTLEQTGQALNITRERVRQLEGKIKALLWERSRHLLGEAPARELSPAPPFYYGRRAVSKRNAYWKNRYRREAAVAARFSR